MTTPVDDPIRMDGDLIAAAVTQACPRILTDAAAREIAERTLLILSGMPGVVVTRGPDDELWPPTRQPTAPVEAVAGRPAEPWQAEQSWPQEPPQPTSWTVEPFRWSA